MLVVDRKNLGWIVLTVAVAIVAYGIRLAVAAGGGDVSASSQLGLIFGIVALGLMVFATLLWENRRARKGYFLFRRKFWLRGHLWLGTLSVVFVFLHAGLHAGGLLTQILWVLTALTTLTGWFGVIMQQFLPSLLTAHEDEVPAIQVEHVCDEMRREADVEVEKSCGWEILDEAIDVAEQNEAYTPTDDETHGVQRAVARFYAADVRPFLQLSYQRHSPLANGRLAAAAFDGLRAMQMPEELSKALDELQRLCDRRRNLAAQGRAHRWLHGWLLIHVPVALSLMVLGIVHTVMSLYY